MGERAKLPVSTIRDVRVNTYECTKWIERTNSYESTICAE